MSDVKKLVSDYLAETILLQLATTNGDRPWACTVHYVSDERLNFYFISRPDRRHSQELTQNANVAGAIVKPHAVGEKPRGLQFEGVAEKVIGEDLERGKVLFKSRFGFDTVDDHLMYVIKPSRIVLFDRINFPDDPQQELKL